MRRGLWTFIGVLIIVACVSVTAARTEIMDRIVATVNGDIITLREVNDRLRKLALASDQRSLEELRDMRQKILNSLIDQKLADQEAAKLGIIITEQDVDNALEHIKKSNNITTERLKSDLQKKGVDLETFRQDLRSEILKSRLIDLQVRAKVVITDEEVERQMELRGLKPPTPSKSEPKKKKNTEIKEVRVRNIMLLIPDNASEEQAKAKVAEAEKIRTEIKRGLDFTEAARKYSVAPNAKDGGKMGLIVWDDIAPRIRAVLKNLRRGDVSKPVVMGQAVQLFQVVDAETRKVKEEKVEDTPKVDPAWEAQREQIRAELMEKRLQDKFRNWLENLRSKAVVEVNL